MSVKGIKPALIVGSGLENFNFLNNWKELEVDTPYGAPSSTLFSGMFQQMEVLILSRHGREHTIPPSQVNNRANIWALKEAGCTHILAVSACGSLREQIETGDIIFPDQFIDFTRHRAITFFESFEPHQPRHFAMPDPFDATLKEILAEAAERLGIRHHNQATVITIEGPRLSTRAESHMFRSWGADIINMSTAPEVILANELQIPYALAALSTDYDAWRENDKAVSWEEIVTVFRQNINKVSKLLLDVLALLSDRNMRGAK
ncbi:MAG: MTAP family purine nucleoside phosphorylase [Bacteroidales bacterium]|nr:MTAP family purine nucleoside phosphorylase [Bacteroidales bacterium]